MRECAESQGHGEELKMGSGAIRIHIPAPRCLMPSEKTALPDMSAHILLPTRVAPNERHFLPRQLGDTLRNSAKNKGRRKREEKPCCSPAAK